MEHAGEKGNIMALTEKKISGGIRFGDWMLVPMDERNWELCHWHVAKAVGRHKGGEAPDWHHMGRYYQYNTFHLAIQYAADAALKEKAHGEQMELLDALHEYAEIVDTLKADVLRATEGALQ